MLKINKYSFFVLISLIICFASRLHALPIISDEEIITISDTQVVFSWQTTNEAASTCVKYGITQPPSTIATSHEGAGITKFHYIIIDNLFPNTTYYYRVYSVSSSGTTESTIKTFKTCERPSGNYLFSFAVLSDLHYAPNLANTTNIRGRPYNSSEAIVDALVSSINQFSPAFTVIKGDMLDSGVNNPATRVTELKAKLDTLTSAVGYSKYYPIPGNHDKTINYGGGANTWVTKNLGILYPAGIAVNAAANSSFNYSFVYNNYRFILLDSSTSTGVTAQADTSYLQTELTTAQTNKQKAFIFLHHEVSEESDIPTDVLKAVLEQDSWAASDWDKIRLSNKAAFISAVDSTTLSNEEPVTAAVFAGHLHDNAKRTFNNVPYIRTCSGLQYPAGFDVYKVYSNGFVQSFYKLPGFSEEISKPRITGTGEVTVTRAQQMYLGSGGGRNFSVTYSSNNTATSPTCLSVQPTTASTNVPTNQKVIITFSKAMTKETTVSDWITLTGTTLNSSDWSWNADKTILTISKTLTASTNYTLTILGGAAGATATDATFFAADQAITFSTAAGATASSPSVSTTPLKNESGTVTDITTDPTPTLTGVATDSSSSTISNIEFSFRTDSSTTWSTWESATPADGAFNTAQESFVFTVTSESQARGKYHVRLRATNSAGITTSSNYSTYSFWIIGEQPEIGIKIDGGTPVNGDPISTTPSFEISVATDKTLTALWFNLNGTRTNILPASPTFANTVYYLPTLTDGSYTIKVEAVDTDNLGISRTSTKEISSLSVASAAGPTIIGSPLNYPNPFNVGTDSTVIAYVLSKASNVIITIHDLSGNLVSRKQYSSTQTGGFAGYNEITWDGKTDGGSYVGNGIYIYLINCDGILTSRGKIMALKR